MAKRRDMVCLRLSKKWLAPLFRGFHSSLAPTARPGSYAGKPLLRKAFCGFAVHPPGGLLLSLRDNSPCAAKSDESLKGPRSSIRQRFFDKLKSGTRGLWPRVPLFQDASTVRKGRYASPRKRLPSTPLRTGLPPRFFRHWRRSAPPSRRPLPLAGPSPQAGRKRGSRKSYFTTISS